MESKYKYRSRLMKNQTWTIAKGYLCLINKQTETFLGERAACCV